MVSYVELILGQNTSFKWLNIQSTCYKTKKSHRKVRLWWRISESNRWPLPCHGSVPTPVGTSWASPCWLTTLCTFCSFFFWFLSLFLLPPIVFHIALCKQASNHPLSMWILKFLKDGIWVENLHPYSLQHNICRFGWSKVCKQNNA